MASVTCPLRKYVHQRRTRFTGKSCPPLFVAAYYGSSHLGSDLLLSMAWIFAWRSRLAIMRLRGQQKAVAAAQGSGAFRNYPVLSGM